MIALLLRVIRPYGSDCGPAPSCKPLIAASRKSSTISLFLDPPVSNVIPVWRNYGKQTFFSPVEPLEMDDWPNKRNIAIIFQYGITSGSGSWGILRSS